MSAQQFALVTGANRGLGFENCRQLAKHGMTVLMGARNAAHFHFFKDHNFN